MTTATPTRQEARANHRMVPSTETAIVSAPAIEPIACTVIDESFGGLGIATPTEFADGRDLPPELTLVYEGTSSVALVRHVAKLPSRLRLGLEWKSQALYRCVRGMIAKRPDLDHQLGRILPSGLSIMWKLFEARQRASLEASADRLRRHLAEFGFENLSIPFQRFQLVLQDIEIRGDTQSPEELEAELHLLMLRCIEAVE